MITFEWGVVLTGSAVVGTLAVFYAVGWGRETTSVKSVRDVPATVEVKAATTPAAPAPRVKTKPLSTFAFTAARGDAWLQARAGSFGSRVLYEGKLMQGETVRLRSRRLWIRFGAASHIDLFINGRRAWLPAFGTFDAFAGPRGVAADRTDYATAAQSP